MKNLLTVSALPALLKGRLFHQFSFTGKSVFFPLLKSYHSILAVCLIIFLSNQVIGQTTDDYRTRNDGDWNGTATWQRYSGSSWVNITTGPSSTNKAITIRSGHTVTVTANVTVDQVIVNSGGGIIVNATRTLTIVDGTGTDFTMGGSFTNNGIVVNGGTFTTSNPATSSGTFTNNGTLITGNTFGTSGTFTNNGTITIGNTFTNTGTFSSSGSITNNTTFTNNNTGTIGGTLTNTSTVNGSSAWSFTSGSEYIHARNGGTIPTATWNTNSTCTVTGVQGSNVSGLGQSFGNFTWNCTSQSADRNLNGALTTVNGNFTVFSTNNKDLILTNSTDLPMNIGGNLAVTGGSLLFTDNNADVTINVGGSFSQTGGSINMSNDNQIGILIMNVGGIFSQSGGSFDFASGSANAARTPSLKVAGNFSQTGSATVTTSSSDGDITNGTITFNKNGTQTFSITTQGNLTKTNFIIASPAILELNSNLTLTSNGTNTRAGNLTVNNGGTLNAKTNQVLSSSGSGANNDFVLSAGATVITANTNGLQSGTSGTVSTSIDNRTFSSSANYIYNGSSQQNSGTFTTSPTANQVNNLTVNNTGGGNGLTLEQTFKIAGTCYFTAGRITSSSSYLLIFNDNAVASGANNNISNPSYVNGPVRKIGNDAFTFPVGKSNVGYMACGISAPGSMTDAFTAEYRRNSATALGSCTAPGLYRVSACEYWQLDRTTGSSSVNVTLSWSGLSPCNAAAYVNDLATLVVAHFNGSSWNAYGNNGGVSGNGAAGTVTWNNVSAFSPFTLGSTSPIANPLRVKFSDVKAYRINDDNKIEWKNQTEENIERYEVERSGDGTAFNKILSVAPKSNNGLEQGYSVLDQNTINGTNFYRIKAIEIDGGFLYSTVVKVVPSADNKSYASAYPNPVSGDQFTLQLNNYQRGNYILRLISSTGQQVMNKSIQHAGGSVSVSIDKPASINSGIYVLQLTGENVTATMKVIIK